MAVCPKVEYSSLPGDTVSTEDTRVSGISAEFPIPVKPVNNMRNIIFFIFIEVIFTLYRYYFFLDSLLNQVLQFLYSEIYWLPKLHLLYLF